jgi:hypothetical protein
MKKVGTPVPWRPKLQPRSASLLDAKAPLAISLAFHATKTNEKAISPSSEMASR